MNDIPIENIDDRQVHVYVPIASRFQDVEDNSIDEYFPNMYSNFETRSLVGDLKGPVVEQLAHTKDYLPRINSITRGNNC